MKDIDIIREFLERNRDVVPTIYFVDFVYLPTNTFYRHLGFYYTLNEAIEKAKDIIQKRFNLERDNLVYNSNLFLNCGVLFDKLTERVAIENDDTAISNLKTVSSIMQELISKGDVDLVERSDLNDYQKKYVLDKIKKYV